MIRLQVQRESNGWSRSELARRTGTAEELGMHPATVGQIESGYIGRPYPSQLEKLARALGFEGDPAELLDEVSSDGDE